MTSHSYNEEVAQAIAHSIVTVYYGEFMRLHARLDAIARDAA